MKLELSYEDCIEIMPEWKGLDLHIDPLIGGITNKLFRVRTDRQGDYVVRIYGQKTELFIDREIEMQNIRLMESSGVTPKLIRYLPEKNITIVEFIPGKAYTNDDFLDEKNLPDLIRPIRLIHQADVKLPRLFDPCIEVHRLFDILQQVGPQYPEFDIAGTLNSLKRISEKANIQHSQYLPCHNDLLADNFIRTENSKKFVEPVCLIDWEYAGMNTPYYEIADMFQEILVPREIEEKILQIYWDGKNISEHIRLTDMFKPFPDIYWFLWSLIQLNISNIEFDYYNYGKVKYDNTQANLALLKERYGINI